MSFWPSTSSQVGGIVTSVELATTGRRRSRRRPGCGGRRMPPAIRSRPSVTRRPCRPVEATQVAERQAAADRRRLPRRSACPCRARGRPTDARRVDRPFPEGDRPAAAQPAGICARHFSTGSSLPRSCQRLGASPGSSPPAAAMPAQRTGSGRPSDREDPTSFPPARCCGTSGTGRLARQVDALHPRAAPRR